ncbi:hypothetical protein BGX27_007768 [Mortierella sp. AM989]|nr:hypothetical protein BGX27_007768 [Mortierella sp. AM989]
MTFSGLPSIRDPKQSLKHSNSSASSTTSSSSTSPSTSAAVVNSTASSSKQPDINSNIKLNDSLPVSTDPNRMGSRSGTLVSSGEPLSAQLIEKSFEDLVQASMNNPSETLVDLRNSNNDNNNARVPSFQKEMKHEQNQQQYQEQQLQQQQHKQQQETRVSTPSTTVATKKKGSPQSFSPAHSAAYRKRLNVNQVCDWCRYRKIRCDRESPCNSCQHSKRECIRTPASQLLNNIKKNSTSDDVEQTESISSSEVGSRSKRSRVDTRDALSPRGRKSYRGSSTSSHHSSSYTSYSSDQDQCGDYDGGDDESDSVISSASPTVGSLTLAGLGLSGLTNLASTNNLSGNFGVPSNLETTRHGSNFQLVSGSANESTLSLLGGGQGGFQDQEHLDRMKRIEALLSNVVPGAAEFIATGATSSERKPLSVVTQGLEQLHRDIVTTPQEQLSKISLASPVVNSTSSWSSTPLQNESQQSPMPTIDYVERMKRIELLLSTVKDLPLAKTIASQSRGHIPPAPLHPDEDMESAKKPSKAYTKKQSKNELKKNRAYNGNGAVVKRPHVAAGFAGQKPPPKLPQAIAEAAQRKQSARKKRNAAGAVRASFTVSTLTASSPNMASDSAAETDSKEATPGASPFQSSADRGQENRIVTPSPTASFDIPSVIENDHTTPLSQGQHRQFYVTNHRESTSFHSQQQQYKQQPFHAYSHPSSVSDIGSLTIPFSEPIASYGSLVVPASSSTCSSATSSPRSSRAESVAFDGSASQGGLNISSDVASDVSASLDQIMFPGSHGYLQDQQLSQVHQLSGGFNMESFDFRENNFPASDNTPHPLAQQYHNYQQPQQHSIHIGQDAGFGTFVMNSDESLEMLMKKNVGKIPGPGHVQQVHFDTKPLKLFHCPFESTGHMVFTGSTAAATTICTKHQH